MPPEWGEQARGWLAKANSDLATARILILGAERHLDTGSYHCQQAAEKAFKSWLTSQGVIFPKTHLLDTLLDLCLATDTGFEIFRTHADELTPLATGFRYPGDAFEPTFAESTQALALAEEVVQFVSRKLGESLSDDQKVDSCPANPE